MVEVLVKGRYVQVPQAVAARVRSNVWTVVLPRDEATERLLRTTLDEDGLDDIVLSIDQAEAMQALVSEVSDEQVTLTVLLP